MKKRTARNSIGALAVATVAVWSLVAGAGTCRAQVTDGLVGQWYFDTGSGTTAFDSSGNNRNGTLLNGPTWVEGVYGYALEFDGANDYVNVPNDAVLDMGTSDFTLEAWVRIRSGSVDNDGIINKGNLWDEGYRILTQVQGPGLWSLQWHIESPDNKQSRRMSTQNMNSNIWHHWAVAVDRDVDEYIYIDGVLATGFQMSDPITDVGSVANGWAVYFGRHAHLYFPGTIDAIRIYDRALSQAEIQENMAQAGPVQGTVISIQ